MGSNTPATTTQQQSSTTTQNPYAPSVPLINKAIGGYLGVDPAVTAQQTQAGQNLWGAASGIPNLTPQATQAVQQIFGNAGMLPQAYQTTQANLGAQAASNPDPMSDPGVQTTLQALNKQITNQVKGQYAGSGRDPSGAGTFAGTLATGLAQGEAPTIMSQYNTDVANKMAANQILQGAAGATSTGMGNWLTNVLQGAGTIPGLAMGPATAQAAVANQLYGQPIQNLNQLLAPTATIAGLGGTTDATGTMTGTQTPANNPMSNILGGISGGAGLIGALGQAGGASGIAGLAPLLALSDRRAKRNIKEVGRTHDDQKIYSFKYKGHSAPQIGMMADEVEKKTPEAVVRGPGGMKYVDYDAATRKAATMGMLSKMAA